MPRMNVETEPGIGQELRDLMNMMVRRANELDEMTLQEIPEAFPMVPVESGPEGEWAQYFSVPDELFGAQPNSELEDVHRSFGVLNKLQRALRGASLIVSSLYPTEIQGSSHEIKVKDKFDSTKDWLDNAQAALDTCQRSILMGIDSGIRRVINRSNLRNLKLHITRFGFEYVTEGKIPQHLAPDRFTELFTGNIEEQINQKLRELGVVPQQTQPEG